MRTRRHLTLSATGLTLATLTPLLVTVAGGTASSLAANSHQNFVRTVTRSALTHSTSSPKSRLSGFVQNPELGPSVGEGAESAGSTKSKGNGADRSHAARVSLSPTPTASATSFTAPAGSDSGFEGL